ncbi:hypothetical protein QZH41_005169 [Actinostola sp. cb2023]|nr:hypothetical protein QZH41_005169 [Actinostola sp. cb2023]
MGEKVTSDTFYPDSVPGITRGYKEAEIIDAVIRSISPHSSFRSYVETLTDLSLAKLRKILRVHYREKSASELYHQLATTFQDAKESPQQFLMRALDMRNKVIFASQEADCDFNYGLKLIQNTFLKSFETGLRDDILATNLRPMLRTQNLTDEELMKSVNEMASHQIERKNKLATERQKTARVNVCVSEGGQKNVEHPKKTDASSDDVSRKLLAEIKQMRSELSNLKVQVDATNVSNAQGYSEQTRPFRGRGRGRGRPYNQQRRAWGCSYCKERGTAESCRHCFACGGDNHLAYNCPQTTPDQGNDGRLPPRDRE